MENNTAGKRNHCNKFMILIRGLKFPSIKHDAHYLYILWTQSNFTSTFEEIILSSFTLKIKSLGVHWTLGVWREDNFIGNERDTLMENRQKTPTFWFVNCKKSVTWRSKRSSQKCLNSSKLVCDIIPNLTQCAKISKNQT